MYSGGPIVDLWETLKRVRNNRRTLGVTLWKCRKTNTH